MTGRTGAGEPVPDRHAVIEQYIRQGRPPDQEALADVVDRESPRLGSLGAERAGTELRAGYLGLGPLDDVVAERDVTDVLVNGTGTVWVDRGRGLERHPGADLAGPPQVRRLATRLATTAGRRLDESQPWVDGLLPTGVRLHAILPPLVEDGAHISLRVPRLGAATLGSLERSGMLGPHLTAHLRRLVRERTSFIVSGGTGTGKTTLLGAMLGEVSHDERVVVVEDVRELGVRHPHVVRLQARSPNVEGVGQVSMVDLVRQALRMRPDRLVVGEVRGPEVRELLAALNTGHEGGCGTVHANSPEDVPARFEALGALAGMSRAAVWTQLSTAVEVVVHLRRDPAGRRRVDSVQPLRIGHDGGVASWG